jgi:hypothetical protein
MGGLEWAGIDDEVKLLLSQDAGRVRALDDVIAPGLPVDSS